MSYDNLDQPFVIQSLGNQEGVILDLLEANRGQYSKVYSLLGINNVNYSSDISSVKTYFEKLREYFPDATIYIESLFPTTETGLVEAGKSNEVIKEYNAKVYELCQEFGYHYLDVASVMMDKDGRLPEGLARDGIHFEDFSAVRDYIYTHTVTEQE